MNKRNLLLILSLFLFVACSDKDPHKGLYNAIFTNYDNRIDTLEENLTVAEISEIDLSNRHKVVKVEVLEKESSLNLYKKIDEVSLSLDTLEVSDNDIEKLNKIKTIIKQMKQTTLEN